MFDDVIRASFSEAAGSQPAFPDGNWIFALPSLSLKRILILGDASRATLQTLQYVADHIDHYPHAGRVEPLYDLIYSQRQPAASDWSAVNKLLGPSGMVYFETRGLSRPTVPEYMVRVQELWLSPVFGRMHTAVPCADSQTIHSFLSRRLHSVSLNTESFEPIRQRLRRKRAGKVAPTASQSNNAKRPRRHQRWVALLRGAQDAAIGLTGWIERMLLRENSARPIILRRGHIYRRASAVAGQAPDAAPEYVQLVAREQNLDIDGYRWGFAAKGRYRSQKLLFYLFRPENSSPEILVKLVRSAEFNARLEREYRGLQWLTQNEVMPEGTHPRTLFLGYHNQRAMIGETIIAGAPFETTSGLHSDCPFARNAVQWLIDLAGNTAVQTDGAQLAGHFNALVDRFSELYCPTLEQQTFLQQQADAVRGHTLPLVFQHGDPGSWNLVVTGEQIVAFLDWENAALQGPPLWDLFYFLRSLCVAAGERNGRFGNFGAFEHFFLNDSQLSPLIVSAIHQYTNQLDIAPTLVKPLFYMCWVFWAIKQAPMVGPSRLQTAFYWQSLQTCITRPDAPTLAQIFSLKSERNQAESAAKANSLM